MSHMLLMHQTKSIVRVDAALNTLAVVGCH